MIIKPFNSIGKAELDAVEKVMRGGPLSGYLAGKRRGGYWVQKLEDEWAGTFGVKHAIACNSCTSAILAAAVVSGVGPHTNVVVPALTMSATAAAPHFLGADLIFGDVDEQTCGLQEVPNNSATIAVISTNLFGHVAPASSLLLPWCAENNVTLIEDNAQAILATSELGKYTGTIGHIGCWSLNVHKHIQSGEGGIITTDDDQIAEDLRSVVNHGECRGGDVGLNLRLPELCAAVACVQLSRIAEIVNTRIEQANRLTEVTKDAPGVVVRPGAVDGCRNVYYHVAWQVTHPQSLTLALADAGFPVWLGYVEPLYHLPAFKQFARNCPTAEKVNKRLVLFENCAWDMTPKQIEHFGRVFCGHMVNAYA